LAVFGERLPFAAFSSTMGYLPLDDIGATIFFQLASAQYERGSIILPNCANPSSRHNPARKRTMARHVGRSYALELRQGLNGVVDAAPVPEADAITVAKNRTHRNGGRQCAAQERMRDIAGLRLRRTARQRVNDDRAKKVECLLQLLLELVHPPQGVVVAFAHLYEALAKRVIYRTAQDGLVAQDVLGETSNDTRRIPLFSMPAATATIERVRISARGLRDFAGHCLRVLEDDEVRRCRNRPFEHHQRAFQQEWTAWEIRNDYLRTCNRRVAGSSSRGTPASISFSAPGVSAETRTCTSGWADVPPTRARVAGGTDEAAGGGLGKAFDSSTVPSGSEISRTTSLGIGVPSGRRKGFAS
jgi:hypothetical protein